MLTTEERKARAKQRAKESREAKLRLPFGEMADRNESGVIIRLEAGEDFWLTVLQRGEWQKSDLYPETWRVASIRLSDIADLGIFIRALSARYNAMVDHANSVSRDCGLTRLEPIPGEPPKPEPA